MTRTRFLTSAYAANHGTDPKGRGLWVFRAEIDGAGAVFEVTGTYTEACRHVRRRVPAGTMVTVCP